MQQITAPQHPIHCKIQLPASKSESNRLLIIRALTTKTFTISNLSNADDTVILDSLLKSNNVVLNCGSGGTTFRFLLALLAYKGAKRTLTCSTQLSQRPIRPLVDALKKMGANISYTISEGHPPISIESGNFTDLKTIDIEANISSQFVSALLLIAPKLPNGLVLNLKGKILSQPYIELTLGLMKQHGIKSEFSGNEISILKQDYIANDTTVAADWSAASYFYELAVFAESAVIELEGLNLNSMQGDKIIAQLMEQFGVKTEKYSTGVRLIKNHFKRPDFFVHDFTNCPDLVQTFAFLCAGLGIRAQLNGIENLRFKETDRVQAIKNEIVKMGTEVIVNDHSISILANPFPQISNTIFKSYDDHRMAMSLAPLAIRQKHILINDLNVVSKSFPEYWKVLETAGFSYTQKN